MHKSKGLFWVVALAVEAGLGGCAGHEPNPPVPAEAMKVVAGGKIVTYKAPHDGRIYLRDDDDKHVAFSTDIRRDQVVKYTAANRSVTIDGKVITDDVSDPNHDHSIFFERSDRPDLADRANAKPQ